MGDDRPNAALLRRLARKASDWPRDWRSGARQPRGLVTKICTASQPISLRGLQRLHRLRARGACGARIRMDSPLPIELRLRHPSRRREPRRLGAADRFADAPRRLAICRSIAASLGRLRRGQGVQAGKAELLQEVGRGAKERGTAHGGGASDFDHESILQQAASARSLLTPRMNSICERVIGWR